MSAWSKEPGYERDPLVELAGRAIEAYVRDGVVLKPDPIRGWSPAGRACSSRCIWATVLCGVA